MNTPPATNPGNSNNTDYEIDLLSLAKTFWDGRKIILKCMLFAGIFGILIALISPVEYRAWTSMVPQTSQSVSKLGGLSSLAAIAGFNIDMATSGESLTPLVYPQILKSANFQIELINTPFTFSDVDHQVSLFEYYSKISKPGILSLVSKYTIGLPRIIISAIKGNPAQTITKETKGPIILSKEQEEIIKAVSEKIGMTLDPENGFFTLEATFHQPLLTAQVTERSFELLQKYITRYKTEKASGQLSFIEERYLEKKKEFLKAQDQLARFRDQNKNVSSAVAHTEEERLQSEYSLAMNVFNELSKQLEQARIKVKEETPVFSVLEQTVVPLRSSKPKKVMIVAIWLFLGAIFGLFMIFGKDQFQNIRFKWNELNQQNN